MDPLHLTASFADGVSLTDVAHRVRSPCDGHRSAREGHEGGRWTPGLVGRKTGWLPFTSLWYRAPGPANPRNTNGIADGVSTSEFHRADGLRLRKRQSGTAPRSRRPDLGHEQGKSSYGSYLEKRLVHTHPLPAWTGNPRRNRTSRRLWRYPAGAEEVPDYSVIRAGCSRSRDGRSSRRVAGLRLIAARPQPPQQPRQDERTDGHDQRDDDPRPVQDGAQPHAVS